MKHHIFLRGLFLCFLLTIFLGLNPIYAQTVTEFPIAVGNDTTFAVTASFDGTNYLIPIVGNDDSQYNLNIQIVSKSGTLIGQRISFGTQAVPGALAAFDGTNFLITWNDFDYKLWGRFITPEGTLAGDSFEIASYGWIGNNSLISDDTGYFIIYEDTLTTPDHERLIYGRFISKTGNVGDPIQISESEGYLDGDIAFDGSNLLVAWRGGGYKSPLIYGQFISKAGVLVDNNFIIDDSQEYSDNPVTVGFDGARYLVCFEDEIDTTNDVWHLYGRFVTPSGTVQERIVISENGNNHFSLLSFDGNNYLITHMNFTNVIMNQVYCKGQYFSPSGVPLGDEFTIFEPIGNKIPIGGVMLFDGTHFLAGVNRVSGTTTGRDIIFTDGDVYGGLVSASLTGVNENPLSMIPIEYELRQNYPNPFNPVTTIQYSIPESGDVTFIIYDIRGSAVMRYDLGIESAGTHQVQWDGHDQSGSAVAAGVYFYKNEVTTKAGIYSNMKKMVIMK